METVDSDQVNAGGGQHSIKLGVTFEDPETPDYEHAIIWGFEPTLATDSQTPILEVRTILHKKYWKEIDANLTRSTTDDGSEIVYSGGWLTGPFETTNIPQSVTERLESIFGTKLATNTIENPTEIFDVELENPSLPSIPDDHSVVLPEFRVQIDGDYTEYLDESDERVTDEHFTSHMKDAETGEILSTSHPLSHNMAWWFTPRDDEAGLQIEKCFHKTWDDKMHGGFEEKYDRETVVESYRNPSDAPSIESLPDEIIRTLSDWFGEPLIKSMLESTGREMPTYAYECFNCDSVSEVTPRGSCPECGSDSTCRYNSLEHYREVIADEDENAKAVKEMLADAELTMTTEQPN